jgi:hypothetical protein
VFCTKLNNSGSFLFKYIIKLTNNGEMCKTGRGKAVSIDDALERACENQIAGMFDVLVRSVNSAGDNEQLIAIAKDRFKTGVELSLQILEEAKQLVETE